MKKITIFLVLIALLFPNVTFGKTLYWKSLLSKRSLVSSSSYFSPVNGVEVDPQNPDIVYLATWGKGVLKSSDGGKHFAPMNNGLSELNTYTVKLNPADSNVIYVGTTTGLFVSYDAGKNLSLLGDMRLNVTSIEFGEDALYAGVLNNGINAGIYRFYQDKWVKVGLEDKDILTIARFNNSTLLVGTSDGLYSFDEKTLSFKFLGFQSSTVNSISVSSKKITIGTSDGVYVSDLDPVYFLSPTKISPLLTSGNFLATYFYRDNPYRVIVGKNDGSLYRIDLEKGTFEKLEIRANSIYSICISSNGRIFVGTESALLWSDNDGQSFKGFASSVFGGDMEVDPNNPSIIYVGSDNGLLKSIDGGLSFVNVGFINERVFSIGINPENSKEIFVGTNFGLFKSVDYGENFSEIKYFSGCSVTMVTVVPKTQTIFVGTDLGVFVSKDDGASWQRILPIKDGDFVLYIAYDPVDPKTAYVATFLDGIYKTVDAGATFQYFGYDDLIISSISICRSNPNVLYVSTLGNIYVSVDGGKTLTKTFNISAGSEGAYIFKQVVVNPNDPNLAFAVGDLVVYGINMVTGLLEVLYDEPVLYMTKDMGKNWEKLDLPNTIKSSDAIYYDEKSNTALILTGIGVLHYDFLKMKYRFYSEGFPEENIKVVRFFNDTLFVGTSSGNVGKSNDNGQTFEFHAKFDVPILCLFESPKDPNVIYAGTSLGLLYSNDFGSTFKRYFSDTVYAVTGFSSQGKDTVFLGTDTGIFRINGSLDSFTKIYDGTCSALFYEDNKLYAGTDKGLVVSKDLETFEVVKEISSTINTINVFDGKLFVGTNTGLYIIEGDTFNLILSDSVIFDMIEVNGVIYVATDSGVLVLNKDFSYTAINNGLTSYYATSIAEGKNGQIFLGTDGGGIYRLESVAVLKVKEPSGGRIEPSGEFEMSPYDEKDFIITPFPGFKLKDIFLNKVSILSTAKDLGNGSYVVKVSGIDDDSVLEATFEPITFVITALAGSDGSITPSGKVLANYGESKAFLISPNSGYKIKDVFVDGKSVGPVSKYTFENITSNHTIEALFEKEITQTVIILQIGSSSFTVNGKTEYLDSPPVIKNSRTLIPIRTIIESLGGSIAWDTVEKKVTINLHTNTIELWIGRPTARVNGVFKPIDSTNPKVVPEIINGRTMLPLRFVTENLGCQVQWDPNTKTITITYE